MKLFDGITPDIVKQIGKDYYVKGNVFYSSKSGIPLGYLARGDWQLPGYAKAKFSQ